jgi:ribonuclease P protein component|tara:strand:- start:2486 stop:2812 length:327 start_codon:yes stop_codon:yes gene_type:complete
MGVKRSISSKEGFSSVFKNPDFKASNKTFLLLAKENKMPIARIGVAQKKKNTKLAVHRNSIKRKIKESFRERLDFLKPMDYVVLVKRNLVPDDIDLEEDLKMIWDKCK